MALPVVPLGTGSVEIGGTSVDYHSMSRAQALRLNGLRGQEADAEVLILTSGTGCTEDEARAFREANDTATVGVLVDAILLVSGLIEAPNP